MENRKKVYIYDEKTNEFMFEDFADKDPLEKEERYLFPPHSTTVKAPKTKVNEKAVFNGFGWNIVPDYRGKEQVSTETQEISVVDEIGDLKENHFIISQAQINRLNDYTKAFAEDGKLVIKKSLPEYKEFKRREINQMRDETEQSGFEYLGKIFDSDAISVQRMTLADNTALKAKMAGEDFSVEWTCKDNSKILLNAEQILGLLPTLTEYGNMLHTKASDLKAKIDSAATVEEVEAISWEN